MLTRRSLLLGAAALPLAACSAVGGGATDTCRTPDELVSFDSLAGAPLSYEETGTRQPFQADPRMVSLLEQWAEEWVELSGLGALREVSTYGAYVDRCGSWHQAGRAFDFAVVRHEDGEVSCRFDQWEGDQGRTRDYWRLAASLAARFTYTLTYRYDGRHHNHIHIDNSVHGGDGARFRQGSHAQTQVVQGALRHVFERDCPENGEFDQATIQCLREVQAELGISEPLTDETGWSRFLLAAARG